MQSTNLLLQQLPLQLPVLLRTLRRSPACSIRAVNSTLNFCGGRRLKREKTNLAANFACFAEEVLLRIFMWSAWSSFVILHLFLNVTVLLALFSNLAFIVYDECQNVPARELAYC